MNKLQWQRPTPTLWQSDPYQILKYRHGPVFYYAAMKDGETLESYPSLKQAKERCEMDRLRESFRKNPPTEVPR